ncbi:type I-B CRISPR-associated endonuclease Cas1b [Alkalibaculum bacchi]|uniref:type I-B CRISPR-associated endonuclease Cas1b n=1 Tax=Alkalibaculum bacchi TaxID=645887 RepID=UPI0026E9628B|nr:type I-B CRISPR-associated endonuclease Cas1b [Alkalibaculum bacchi]
MKEETRYIFSKGDLMQKDLSIVFKNEKGNNYLPIKDIRELYCMNDITLTTKFLSLLSKARIVVHFFDYYGHYVGTFYPKENLLSGKLLLKQAEKYNSDRLYIAKAIVLGISKNIHSLLYHYYRHDKKELKPFLDWLKVDVPKQLNKATKINMILMIEGNIWLQFYQSFSCFLPNDFIMNKRVRRPPDNPINALISFGNTLLYTKTITQIYHTHLNQTISYLHAPSEGRFSLSLDLSEVFKPAIVFRTIFDCINNRKITVEKHFIKELNYCVLNEEGRKIFVRAFENRMNNVFMHNKLKRNITYKQAIKIDGYKLIKYILEDKEFIPFSMENMQ